MNKQWDANRMEEALLPYIKDVSAVPKEMYEQLAQYLRLLERWNARTNLTSVRDPEQVVRRHFGESLFAAGYLGECETLLDFGSGAGFPGLPMQLLRPDLQIMLAESQNKKATFLREVVRSLQLRTEVWAGRVESMPEARRFGMVVMRSVDDMERALQAAALRTGSSLMVLSTSYRTWQPPEGFHVETVVAMPGSTKSQVFILETSLEGV